MQAYTREQTHARAKMSAQHTRAQRQAQAIYTLTAKSTHTRPEGHGCPRMVWMHTVGQFGMGGHGK